MVIGLMTYVIGFWVMVDLLSFGTIDGWMVMC